MPSGTELIAPHTDVHALHFEKGAVVFHQGDKADSWYEVVSGTVRTCRFLIDGHRQLTGFYFSGDVFGVDDGRYQVTAETITEASLRRHPLSGTVPEIEAVAKGTPHQRAYMAAQQLIHLLGHRTAVERLSAFLLYIGRRPVAGDLIEVPMSRSDIADHLGLTIHTVSRTVTMLARRGVIQLMGRQRMRILDRAALMALAGESNDTAPPRTPFSPASSNSPQDFQGSGGLL
jgi:CRP/FNR family transcriptional regulator, nitrogen fixation regulation protein